MFPGEHPLRWDKRDGGFYPSPLALVGTKSPVPFVPNQAGPSPPWQRARLGFFPIRALRVVQR